MTGVLRIGVLAIGSGAVGAVLAGAPATDPSARVPGPGAGFGEAWQTVSGFALYDPGQYGFESGYSYLGAAIQATLGETPEPALARQRATTAVSLFEAGLTRSPADAASWVGLALAERTRGNIDRADAALMRSHDLAPHNRVLARLRLSIVLLEQDETLSPAVRGLLRVDFAHLEDGLGRKQRGAILDRAPFLSPDAPP